MVSSLRHYKIPGLGTLVFNVGPRRIEVRVVRHNIAVLHRDGEKDLLCCTSLVGRDDLLKARDALHSGFKSEEGPAACV